MLLCGFPPQWIVQRRPRLDQPTKGKKTSSRPEAKTVTVYELEGQPPVDDQGAAIERKLITERNVLARALFKLRVKMQETEAKVERAETARDALSTAAIAAHENDARSAAAAASAERIAADKVRAARIRADILRARLEAEHAQVDVAKAATATARAAAADLSHEKDSLQLQLTAAREQLAQLMVDKDTKLSAELLDLKGQLAAAVDAKVQAEAAAAQLAKELERERTEHKSTREKVTALVARIRGAVDKSSTACAPPTAATRASASAPTAPAVPAYLARPAGIVPLHGATEADIQRAKGLFRRVTAKEAVVEPKADVNPWAHALKKAGGDVRRAPPAVRLDNVEAADLRKGLRSVSAPVRPADTEQALDEFKLRHAAVTRKAKA